MNSPGLHAKSRYVWQPRGLKLLRESRASRYARAAVPGEVNGLRIEFPETAVSLGLRVVSRSRLVRGEALEAMLYRPETRDGAVAIALTALEALYRASVQPGDYAGFRYAFGLIRLAQALAGGLREAPGLPGRESQELISLVTGYLRQRAGEKRVLLHGDLSAAHLIVDASEPSLAFVDLEMMHVGKPVTNLVQLWLGFHLASPRLGSTLYDEYARRFPGDVGGRFQDDARAELTLRCYLLSRGAARTGNTAMKQASAGLLRDLRAGARLADLCSPGQAP